MNPTTSSPLNYAYGHCHALTAAVLELAGAGEALGLAVDGEIRHSVYRPPNSDRFVDALGVTEDLAGCARRYCRRGEMWQWLRLSSEQVELLAAGRNRERVRRLKSAARPLARRLLALV